MKSKILLSLLFLNPIIIHAQTAFSPYGGMLFLDHVFHAYCIDNKLDDSFLYEPLSSEELKVHQISSNPLSGSHIVFKNLKFIGYKVSYPTYNSCTVSLSTPEGLKKIMPFRVDMDKYAKDKKWDIIENPVGEINQDDVKIRYASYSLSGIFGTPDYGKQKEIWYVDYILLNNKKTLDSYLDNNYPLNGKGIQIELNRITKK